MLSNAAIVGFHSHLKSKVLVLNARTLLMYFLGAYFRTLMHTLHDAAVGAHVTGNIWPGLVTAIVLMLVNPVVRIVHHSMVVVVESVWLCCVVPNLMVV